MSLSAGDIVCTDDQRKLLLGPLIKSGGAGSVYHLPSLPLLVAKIYHESVNRREYERKVAAMLELSPELTDLVENGHRYVQIAWPQLLLRDERGRFLGFAMPAVDVQATSELECILQERQARAAGLPTGLGAKVTLAANLAAVIAEIHRQGHHVIDLKPVNLRFYTHSLYMAMLDCDGFSIQGKGERLAAEQITPDYLAPEFQSQPIPALGEEQQDRFALAVVIFQLLNFGIHPFTGRPTSERVPTDIPGRIAGRYYAYGATANPGLLPSPVSGHGAMPAGLRVLFDRAFDGAGTTRPAAVDWAAMLRTYAQRSSQRLVICENHTEHQYFAGMACAACARAALIAKTAKTSVTARSRFASPGAISPVGGMRIPVAAHHPHVRPYSTYAAATRLLIQPQPPQSATMGSRVWLFVRLLFVGAFVLGLINQCNLTLKNDHDQPYLGPEKPEQPGGTTQPPPVQTPPGTATTQVSSDDDLSPTLADAQEVVDAVLLGESTRRTTALSKLRDAAKKHRSAGKPLDQPAFERFVENATYTPSERAFYAEELQRALAADPWNSENAFEMGWLCLLEKDNAAASRWFLLAIRANPDLAKAWYGYGVVHFGRDENVLVAILAIAEIQGSRSRKAQQMRDEFPPEMLSQAGVDPDRFSELQVRAQQLAKQIGAGK